MTIANLPADLSDDLRARIEADDTTPIETKTDDEMRRRCELIMKMYRANGIGASMLCLYKRYTTIYEPVADGRTRLAWFVWIRTC